MNNRHLTNSVQNISSKIDSLSTTRPIYLLIGHLAEKAIFRSLSHAFISLIHHSLTALGNRFKRSCLKVLSYQRQHKKKKLDEWASSYAFLWATLTPPHMATLEALSLHTAKNKLKQTSAALNPTSAAIIKHQEQPAITLVTFTQKSRK